uniref:Sugar phosphate exchanger 3 n=1 Tax=Echinococcus granulosus TaxID=6210 RepID=A0A068WJC2_ECHGR|nr:Glycerol 3 phosphate transporter [Echinococcus granulosus]
MMILPVGYVWIRSRFLHQSKGRHQIFILLLTFTVYVLYHASRKPLSVVKTVFHKKCIPTPSKEPNWCQWKPFDADDWSHLVGSLEYVYLVCYAFAMFPCGHLAERIDLRIFLTIGMVTSGFTTILFGLGYYFDIHIFAYYFIVQVLSLVFSMFFFEILAGFTQATGWPAVVTILSNWRGLIMGVWNAHTNVGNVLGSIIAGVFVNQQWGASFVVPGFLLGAGAYIVYIVLVDRPPSELDSASVPTHAVEQHRKSLTGYYGDVKTLANLSYKEKPISFCAALWLPNVMTYALALFFSKLVAYTFLYWLPNYLANVSSEGISAEKAAWLSTIFDIGGICGGILAGLLSDTTSSEPVAVSPQESSLQTLYFRAVTCASMLLIAAPSLFFYQLIAASLSFTSMVVLFICGGLVTGPCALITTAVSADLGTQPSLQGNSKALATVTAIIDGTGSLGAALGPFLTGILVYYGWHAVFMMLIFADLVALAITLVIACRNRNGGAYEINARPLLAYAFHTLSFAHFLPSRSSFLVTCTMYFMQSFSTTELPSNFNKRLT